jgi:acid phosphatase type 7
MRVAYPLALGVLACTSDRMTQPSDPSFSGTGTVTLVGAGDIAGCRTTFKSPLTARVVDSLLRLSSRTRAFTAGDNVYERGRASEWKCYDQTWGQFKTRTWFTIGNHELSEDTAGTATYNYILGTGADSGENGKRGKLYHVHDHGAWRLYFLNSERNILEQRAWLQKDMDANPRKCQLMVFHRPLYTSSTIPMLSPAMSTATNGPR